MSIDNFHVLHSRLRLTGTLITRTALRIGSGGAGELDAADLPVLRDADGLPLIPGGSLKGVLRSTIESLVRAAERRDRGLWACDPLLDRSGKDRACGAHGSNERAKAIAEVDKSCATCRLFGSRVLASHVRISDSMVRVSAEDLRRLAHAPGEAASKSAEDADRGAGQRRAGPRTEAPRRSTAPMSAHLRARSDERRPASSPHSNPLPAVGPLPGRGQVVKCKLIGLSKKGKWRVAVLGRRAEGVLDPTGVPADLTEGQEVSLVVDSSSINADWALKWPTDK